MGPHKYYSLDETAHFWVGVNDTSGSGDDGATALFDVILASDGPSAIPIFSGSAVLKTHANIPAGYYHISFDCTVANGFAVGNEYSIVFTILADSQNPTGAIGSFKFGGTELSAIPGVEADFMKKIDALYEYFILKKTVASGLETLFKDDGTTPLATAILNKTPSLYTKGEMS